MVFDSELLTLEVGVTLGVRVAVAVRVNEMLTLVVADELLVTVVVDDSELLTLLLGVSELLAPALSELVTLGEPDAVVVALYDTLTLDVTVPLPVVVGVSLGVALSVSDAEPLDDGVFERVVDTLPLALGVSDDELVCELLSVMLAVGDCEAVSEPLDVVLAVRDAVPVSDAGDVPLSDSDALAVLETPDVCETVPLKLMLTVGTALLLGVLLGVAVGVGVAVSGALALAVAEAVLVGVPLRVTLRDVDTLDEGAPLQSVSMLSSDSERSVTARSKCKLIHPSTVAAPLLANTKCCATSFWPPCPTPPPAPTPGPSKALLGVPKPLTLVSLCSSVVCIALPLVCTVRFTHASVAGSSSSTVPSCSGVADCSPTQ
jgi:hypothetical protein